MLLAAKADEFIGTITSTFSSYIQFLRYIENKTYNNYSNIRDGKCCRFLVKRDCTYDWVKYRYSGGHPVSWHAFWNIIF